MNKFSVKVAMFALAMGITLSGWASGSCDAIIRTCERIDPRADVDNVPIPDKQAAFEKRRECVLSIISGTKKSSTIQFSDDDKKACTLIIKLWSQTAVPG